MPGTFSNIVLHIIFSTKHRLPQITPDLRPRLYDYLGGCIRGEKGVLYAIGGMPDHMHLLFRWRNDPSVSDLMRKVKGGSSRWVHETVGVHDFAWQESYASFSVSQSAVPDVRSYIKRQEEHHRHRTFKEEYLEFLVKNEIEFDPQYVFD